MLNIGRRVALVNNAFFGSRNAASIERKMLQYKTLSIKYHHCTLNEIKTQVCTLSDVFACVSIHCADQIQHTNRDLSTKSIDNTLQTCVDTENEYQQAHNTGVGGKVSVFVVCINVILQVMQ